MMFPKPAKPERGTARAKRWMSGVAQLPCVICGARPVIVHHIIHDRYAMRKASDLETIPLCWAHHDAESPEGIHRNKARWKILHGPDHEYLPHVASKLMETGNA